jgi:hypothetical protein
LTDEGDGLFEQATKTPIGRVLTAADKERQTILAGLAGDGATRAQRLLSLRDEFAKVVPQFQKAIGPWEQARLAARTARTKEAAGAIPSAEREKAELTLKDAERTLSAVAAAAEKVLAELRPLVSALKAAHAWDADEAEFKKIMAEYDALKLRLVNTPTGRALALVEDTFASDQTLEGAGVAKAALPTAQKLFSLRAKIITQSREADKHIYNLHRWAADGYQANPDDVQGLKFRNGALRGLVDDLKKVTDELDPPPTVESEFKKVMADYDALVLRLAKTKVGRALALFPAGKVATADGFNEAFPNPYDLGQAKRLLDKRGQILAQVNAADKAISDRTAALVRQKQAEHELADPATRTQITEAIQKAEHDAKVATAALGTLIDDLKKMADEIDPPKGK